MSLVYVIAMQGGSEYFVPGVWSTPDRAIAAATELAEQDGIGWYKGRPDGYHDWNIYAYSLDGGADSGGLVGTLSWETKGYWDHKDHRDVEKAPWVPPTNLHYEEYTP